MQAVGEVEALLSPRRVEEYTNGLLTVPTLAWWRHSGNRQLPFGRLGKRVIYRKSDVDAFIAAAFEAGKASA